MNRKPLESAIDRVLETAIRLDFTDKSVYGNWLAQAYYFVRHSTPMLALSCGRAIDNREYHLRCIAHLAEEKGHDRMLLNDLKGLGFSADSIPELPSTKALYQTQYYWIEHVNPISFLGYVLVLEGLAIRCGPQVISQVQQFGSHSFLDLHAEEDVTHLERAFLQIEKLPEKDQQDVLANALQASSLYRIMLGEILELSSKPLRRSA